MDINELNPTIGTFGGDVLICPNCRHGCLHHRWVGVYARGEDDPFTVTVLTNALTGTTALDTVESHECLNPSGRRQGLRIEFYCEGCLARPVLCFAQHKGETLVRWEPETVRDG